MFHVGRVINIHTKYGLCVHYVSPYRHSEEMIKKLESAGLGFYVRATETQQKLGLCAVDTSFSSLAVLYMQFRSS